MLGIENEALRRRHNQGSSRKGVNHTWDYEPARARRGLAFVLPIPAERRREAEARVSILGVKRQEKEIETGVV